MIELLCDLLVGVALMFAVFGTAGIALSLGALAAAVAGTAIDEFLRRRPG